MKTNLNLIFITITVQYFASAVENEPWVNDVLMIGSSNGVESLKAPIIPPTGPEKSGYRGRSAPKLEEDMNKQMDMTTNDSNGGAKIPPTDQMVPPEDGAEAGNFMDDAAPGIPEEYTEGPDVKHEPQLIMDYVTKTDNDDTGEPEGLSLAVKERKMHRQFQEKKAKTLHKPAVVNPLVQVLMANMMVKRNNQQQVIVNAYKRLGEINKKIVSRIS